MPITLDVDRLVQETEEDAQPQMFDRLAQEIEDIESMLRRRNDRQERSQAALRAPKPFAFD